MASTLILTNTKSVGGDQTNAKIAYVNGLSFNLENGRVRDRTYQSPKTYASRIIPKAYSYPIEHNFNFYYSFENHSIMTLNGYVFIWRNVESVEEDILSFVIQHNRIIKGRVGTNMPIQLCKTMELGDYLNSDLTTAQLVEFGMFNLIPNNITLGLSLKTTDYRELAKLKAWKKANYIDS